MANTKRPFKGLVSKLRKKSKNAKAPSTLIQGHKVTDAKKKTTTEEKIERNKDGEVVRKVTTVTEEYIADNGTGAGKQAKTKTQVIFVLDKSSSMATGRQLTIDGFNKQVETLRQNNDANTEYELSLITFSDLVINDVRHSELGAVPPLTWYTYVPYGNTALFDAIGRAISLAEEKNYSKDVKNAVLIAIFTDGAENASKYTNEYGLRSDIISRNMKNNWTFTVVGPRGQLHRMEALGILPGNIAGFNPGSEQSRSWVNDVMTTHTMNFTAARSAGASGSNIAYASALASNAADPSLSKNADADKDWPFVTSDVKIGQASAPSAWPFPTSKAADSTDTDSK